ncbi:cylicin-2-like [Homarus americanus]|uniref:Uncharacterized protein n=1 Tax=Homarus americanus TaxID=6706 RepID=A0A8J5K3F0_HOMAM|nr:cylicin-2-like [Homarus americanus]KAG7166330.1 hypothetical protein Hamer_G011162 [Homarus americanus]
MRGRGEMMVKSRLTAVCFASMLVVMVTPWPILPHPTTDVLAKFLPPNTTDEEPPIDYSEYYDNFSDVDIMDYHFILLNPDRKGAETDDRVEKRENPKGDIKSYEGVDERNERELTSEGERRRDKRQDRKVTGGNKKDEGEERSVGEHNNKRDEGKNKRTTDKIKNQREKENKSQGEISRDNELQEREIIAGKNISGQLYDGDIEIDETLLKYILPDEDQMLSAINP